MTKSCLFAIAALATIVSANAQGTGAALGRGIREAFNRTSTGAVRLEQKYLQPARVQFNWNAGARENVERAVSKAELQSLQTTGTMNRTGRTGNHYVAGSEMSMDAKRVHQRFDLPGPVRDARVTMEVPKHTFSPPARVPDVGNMKGGSYERSAPGAWVVPVKVIKATSLKK